ncbi:RGS domain-containing protein [Limtongia smithiae]|uniref:RGS domain-containing protein n=1 Tax=Limtongia smithiae TaxID=1125753 RepID=UPI0034CE1C61
MSQQTPRSRQRLPTLFEVLNRRTLPPVDLYSFYLFMRDQYRSVDYLDFWLDIEQHMALCRLYVGQLRRSVLLGTPDLEKDPHKRRSSSMIFEALHAADGMEGEASENKRLSLILRSEAGEYGRRSSSIEPGDIHALQNSTVMAMERKRQLAAAASDIKKKAAVADAIDAEKGAGLKSKVGMADTEELRLTRANIRDSARSIMATYLVGGAQCEIALPLHLTRGITTAIEVDGRDDPELFDEAQEYVFQAMEREAFPIFLSYRALGNLVPGGAVTRLLFGLLGLFAAFWVAFILIFLDYHKTTRLWLILPFSIGVYGCLSYQYYLDPILVFFGFGEQTYFHFARIKEPYIKALLVRRAIWVMGLIVLLIVCLCVLFGLVPGRRL